MSFTPVNRDHISAPSQPNPGLETDGEQINPNPVRRAFAVLGNTIRRPRDPHQSHRWSRADDHHRAARNTVLTGNVIALVALGVLAVVAL